LRGLIYMYVYKAGGNGERVQTSQLEQTGGLILNSTSRGANFIFNHATLMTKAAARARIAGSSLAYPRRSPPSFSIVSTA